MLAVQSVGKLGTAWQFAQYRPDPDGVRRLISAEGLGDFRGPREDDPAIIEVRANIPLILNNLTDEGENDLVEVYFDDTAVRSALYARFYNDTAVETDTLTTITNEMSGNGYGALTYTRGTDWTVSGGSAAVGATKTLTASGGSIGPFTDMLLATVSTGTAGLAIAYVALSTSRTLADTETLDVTPTVTVS